MKARILFTIMLAVAFLPESSVTLLHAGDQHTEINPKQPVKKVTGDHIATLETTIENIIRSISDKPIKEVELPKLRESSQMPPLNTEEQTKKRLEAAIQSLRNISLFLATKNTTTKAKQTRLVSTSCDSVGCNCHFVRECVYIYCCQWGAPPSDPGTVKCMKQCCGAWETRFVCD